MLYVYDFLLMMDLGGGTLQPNGRVQIVVTALVNDDPVLLLDSALRIPLNLELFYSKRRKPT